MHANGSWPKDFEVYYLASFNTRTAQWMGQFDGLAGSPEQDTFWETRDVNNIIWGLQGLSWPVFSLKAYHGLSWAYLGLRGLSWPVFGLSWPILAYLGLSLAL